MADIELRDVLKKYWGYDEFLPLQAEAIRSGLDGGDSLVVLPTGGGKSLCYQLPAIVRQGLTVVVSPLISLMKDQVDSLNQIGINAAALNSSIAAALQQEIFDDIKHNQLDLLYLAPERLMTETTLQRLGENPPASIAIDEAHCISSWGHDFRPEYRQLKSLRETFPDTVLQAYTATATPQVRDDIVQQLGMNKPKILVGSFHRPNLVYHVRRRQSGLNQISDIIERHRDAAGIVYAISRSRVEQISRTLNQLGYRTLPYHAGLTDDQRAANQDAFIHDEVQAIIATIAFGMGIDKSNVRYVIHAELPKSLESYQQETGRAGRDGLEAECWLFYSGGDAQVWRKIIDNSPDPSQQQARKSLNLMQQFCSSTTCRHASLVEHFGQRLSQQCDACDVCLGKLNAVNDPMELGQKILCCIYRCNENFGANHIMKVLAGSRDKQVLKFGHDKLSTWGLLKDESRGQIQDWIEQLVNQQFINRVGEYLILKISPAGWELIRGGRAPELLRAPQPRSQVTPTRMFDSWEGVDRQLFESLRQLRHELATAASVPAYVVFSDATLRDLARRRPTTETTLLEVHGIGVKKSLDYGECVISMIVEHCAQEGVSSNVPAPKALKRIKPSTPDQASAGAKESFELFKLGKSVEEVTEQLERAPSTVWGYLEDYIRVHKITDPTPWLANDVDVGAIEIAASYNDTGRLRPLHEALHGRVSYEIIRIVVACHENREREEATTQARDSSPRSIRESV